MKRRLFKLLTLLSLLLCVAVIAVWVVSHWAQLELGYDHVAAGERPVDVVRVECAAGRGNGWVGCDIYRAVPDPMVVVLARQGCGGGFSRGPRVHADRDEAPPVRRFRAEDRRG